MTNGNTDNAPINDKEINSFTVGHLRDLPGKLYEIESILIALRANRAAAQLEVEQAELDARINAVATGKNADERKLQQEQAIAASPQVHTAREQLVNIETGIAEQEVEQKKSSRQFQAALALAELQAARSNLMSTYNRKETVK